jgi:lipopolysaccharide/colanic/teichoic acid biosynthesis glycosyltransferase
MEYEIEKIKHQSEHEQQLLKTRLSNVLQKQHDVQSEANRKVEQYEFEMNTLRKKIDMVCRRLLDVWGGLTLVVFLLVVFLLLWIFVREQFKAIQHCCGTC